jgi:hypothetical protein
MTVGKTDSEYLLHPWTVAYDELRDGPAAGGVRQEDSTSSGRRLLGPGDGWPEGTGKTCEGPNRCRWEVGQGVSGVARVMDVTVEEELPTPETVSQLCRRDPAIHARVGDLIQVQHPGYLAVTDHDVDEEVAEHETSGRITLDRDQVDVPAVFLHRWHRENSAISTGVPGPARDPEAHPDIQQGELPLKPATTRPRIEARGRLHLVGDYLAKTPPGQRTEQLRARMLVVTQKYLDGFNILRLHTVRSTAYRSDPASPPADRGPTTHESSLPG